MKSLDPIKSTMCESKSVIKSRLKCKESYFTGVRIFCTAVYCLWALM